MTKYNLTASMADCIYASQDLFSPEETLTTADELKRSSVTVIATGLPVPAVSSRKKKNSSELLTAAPGDDHSSSNSGLDESAHVRELISSDENISDAEIIVASPQQTQRKSRRLDGYITHHTLEEKIESAVHESSKENVDDEVESRTEQEVYPPGRKKKSHKKNKTCRTEPTTANYSTTDVVVVNNNEEISEQRSISGRNKPKKRKRNSASAPEGIDNEEDVNRKQKSKTSEEETLILSQFCSGVTGQAVNPVYNNNLAEEKMYQFRRRSTAANIAAIVSELPKKEHGLVRLSDLSRIIKIPYDFTRSRAKELLKQGIYINTGPWTDDEIYTLKKNVESFLACHKKYSVQQLMYPKLMDCDPRATKKYVKENEFYDHVSQGLSRGKHILYLKCVKIFHPFVKNDKFTQKEKEGLFRLREIYGNDWMSICKITGRSNTAMCDQYRNMLRSKDGSLTSNILWTTEEDLLLIKIIRRLTRTDAIAGMYFNLPWKGVGDLMPNRDFNQCRYHWLHCLCWRLCYGDGDINATPKHWKLIHRFQLIHAVYNQNIGTESLINWMDLMHLFRFCISAPQFLMSKWTRLKIKYKLTATDTNLKQMCTHMFKMETGKDLVKFTMQYEATKINPGT